MADAALPVARVAVTIGRGYCPHCKVEIAITTYRTRSEIELPQTCPKCDTPWVPTEWTGAWSDGVSV